MERTGPALAASLPFPVVDEGEAPPLNPADARFDANMQQIVLHADRVREEAADRMPTHATHAVTVDFTTRQSRRDEVVSPEVQVAAATQYFRR